MAEGHENHEVIPLAVPTLFGNFQELLYFNFGQVRAGTKGIIGLPVRNCPTYK
jgi:hypothetical protein